MASTYSSNLRLEIMASGENDSTWGTKTSTNLQLLEAAIAGRAAVTHDDTANYSLTTANGSADEARRMILNIGGALSAARNTVCPTQSKFYVAKNATTGGYATTLKTTAGTGITIPNGKTMLLFCDGTNVVEAIDCMTSPTFVTSVIAGSTTMALLNTVATTINFGGAATAINMGAGAASTLTLSFTTGIALNTSAITTNQATVTALAGATTLLTIGGTGASAVFAIPGTLEASGTTGALTVAGGAYIAKALNVVGAITATSASPQLTLGVLNTTSGGIKFFGSTSGNVTLAPNVAAGASVTVTLPATSVTLNAAGDLTGTTLAAGVVTSSLTTVGALNSGSITSGFGSIDIGVDNFSGGVGTFNKATAGAQVIANQTGTAGNVYGFTLQTANSNAAARNWAMIGDTIDNGSWELAVSAAKGGDPASGGTAVIKATSAGAVTIPGTLGVTGAITGSNQLSLTSAGNAQLNLINSTGGTGRTWAIVANSAGPLRIQDDTASAVRFSMDLLGQGTWTDSANTSAFKFHSFVSNSVEAGNIIRVAQTAAVTFTTTSDASLKNIFGDSDILAAHARTMKYKMRDYEWKSQTGLHFDGPIAQEVYAVNSHPMLVTPGEGKSPWTVNMSGFIPDLIMTAQQQETRLRTLEARLK